MPKGRLPQQRFQVVVLVAVDLCLTNSMRREMLDSASTNSCSAPG